MVAPSLVHTLAEPEIFPAKFHFRLTKPPCPASQMAAVLREIQFAHLMFFFICQKCRPRAHRELFLKNGRIFRE